MINHAGIYVIWISTCSQGRKNVLEGCAPCNELISTSSDISVFHSVFQKTVGPVRFWDEEEDVGVKRFGKCHFWRVSEHMSIIKAWTKSYSPQNSIFQSYLIMRTFKVI